VKRLNGLSGDVLGAIQQTGEVATLLIIAAAAVGWPWERF
jgi:cobalamin synthase